jgi:predicted glycosyltransferase
VISGGGTMNREAAALKVPVYSIFRGKIGAVDQYLVSTGRLTLIECVDDVQNKIALVRRKKCESQPSRNSAALDTIVEIIDRTIRKEL